MKEISKDFWTDGETVFYQNYGMKTKKPIPDVDAETFQVHSHYLASDKNRVYAQSSMREGLQIFTPEDRESVLFFPKEINARAFVDRYNLYNYNSHFIEFDNIAENRNVKYVEWLKANYPNKTAWWNNNENFYQSLKPLAYNFYQHSEGIYYGFSGKLNHDYPIYRSNFNDFYLQLKNADVATFEPLSSVYSKDKNKVYFYSRVITADPASFEVIEHLFAKDKHGIWYNGRQAGIADLTNFKIINAAKESPSHFAKDQHQVYANTSAKKIDKFSGYANLLVPIKNSNPASFAEISDVWAKDSNNVYWFGKPYKKADAATFEKISGPQTTDHDYARDKNHVYIDYGQTLKKGLDGGSFKILNRYWAKDDFVVYCMTNQRVIKSIDVKTFKVLEEKGKAEDKNYFYEYQNYAVVKTKKQ